MKLDNYNDNHNSTNSYVICKQNYAHNGTSRC